MASKFKKIDVKAATKAIVAISKADITSAEIVAALEVCGHKVDERSVRAFLAHSRRA